MHVRSQVTRIKRQQSFCDLFVLALEPKCRYVTLVTVIRFPVCLYRLIILCQRLRFVLTILALYKFVCMYVYCPLLGHFEYMPHGTDRQTDGRTPNQCF